ncbi:MAG: alpha-L-fucosidase [Prolixibacteraceae bacterium]|jgi:alpha-L-fucosidase|nr:alpha-L-fucosidase [Prolixibacteraceae bacterium]
MKIDAHIIIIFSICFIFSSCQKINIPPPSPLSPVPSIPQLEWQEKELYAFVHFTVNTFTDKEWGYGDEQANVFNPECFNPDQWAEVLKKAGFKGAILTAKHHDGFCLWPSRYTDHSVKNISWKNGKGDVVRDFRDACLRHGIEFGIYLSPWDRNRADYSKSSYVEYYQNQLKELLGQYGPAFEIWFDGANGGDGFYGGAREMRKIDDNVYYNWPETFEIVRSFNPKTIIRGDARAASDGRWCGNEKGFVGETNWNMISPDTLKTLGNNRIELLNTGYENGTIWMPAEVDVSIRPGWFYHASEDSLVKTPDELFEIYLNSVGRGSTLLLNVTPDKRGLIPEQDIKSLLLWKEKIDITFSNNLALKSKVTVSSTRGKAEQYSARNLTDGNKETYWTTDDGIISGMIEFEFEKLQLIKYVVIQEYIALGQRIKSFNIEVFQNEKWLQVANSTTIGYKRIVRIDPVETNKLRINITEARSCPVISNVEIY